METTFRETDRAEIVCEHQILLQPRLIVAAVLAFVPLFFLYYLVTGLVEYSPPRGSRRVAVRASGVPGHPRPVSAVRCACLDCRRRPNLGCRGFSGWADRGRSGSRHPPADLSVPISSVLGVSVLRQRRNHRIQIDLAGHKPITVGYEESPREAGEVAARLAATSRQGPRVRRTHRTAIDPARRLGASARVRRPRGPTLGPTQPEPTGTWGSRNPKPSHSASLSTTASGGLRIPWVHPPCGFDSLLPTLWEDSAIRTTAKADGWASQPQAKADRRQQVTAVMGGVDAAPIAGSAASMPSGSPLFRRANARCSGDHEPRGHPTSHAEPEGMTSERQASLVSTSTMIGPTDPYHSRLPTSAL